jgi:hypothetical protein
MRRKDANGTGMHAAPWPLCEPFHVTWERALTDHQALGHRLPYALVVGFWDARTLRRAGR